MANHDRLPAIAQRFTAYGTPCAVIEDGYQHGDGWRTFWRGYVRVPEGSRFEGVTQKDSGELDSAVPGGITYGKPHLPIVNDEGWWIGFDTNHPWMEGMTEDEVVGYTYDLARRVMEVPD